MGESFLVVSHCLPRGAVTALLPVALAVALYCHRVWLSLVCSLVLLSLVSCHTRKFSRDRPKGASFVSFATQQIPILWCRPFLCQIDQPILDLEFRKSGA